MQKELPANTSTWRPPSATAEMTEEVHPQQIKGWDGRQSWPSFPPGTGVGHSTEQQQQQVLRHLKDKGVLWSPLLGMDCGPQKLRSRQRYVSELP